MKLKYIDAIRGIAVTGVIIVHTGQYGNSAYHHYFRDFVNSGARGVQLFFVASAMTIFLSHNRRSSLERNLNRNFFVRRFFRIAPLYYIGIVYYFLQDKFYINFGSNTIGIFLSQFLFIHDFKPLWIVGIVPGGWSIAVEMTFYLLVPFLVSKITNTEQAIKFTVISILISGVLNYQLVKYPLINNHQLWADYIFLFFPSQLPLFGIGIIAYFVVIKNDITIKPSTFFIISVMFVGQMIWGIVIPSHVMFGIGFLVFIIALSKNEYPFIVNNFTCYLGKISFSGYLVHFAVLHWMDRFNFVDFIIVDNGAKVILNYSIRLIIVTVITIGVASAFYQTVEKRFIGIGRKILMQLEA